MSALVAGLSVLAGNVVGGDRIVLDDFGDEVLVVGVDQDRDHVFLTVSDGDRRVETIRFHRLIPVDLAYRPARPEPTWRQVLRRGMPWWAFAVAVAVVVRLVGAPITGGAFLLIVVSWLFGCLAMVTTPERRHP